MGKKISHFHKDRKLFTHPKTKIKTFKFTKSKLNLIKIKN